MQPTWIYHITHIGNLETIISQGCLYCNTLLTDCGLNPIEIGYRDLKGRRGERVVPIVPGGTLNDYVPFYFAPRSPMLFVISRGGVPGYNDGQRSVVHLVASAQQAAAQQLPFVFTDGHAYMEISTFYADLIHLDQIDWPLMDEKYWKDIPDDGDRARRRQAEFLVHQQFPWSLVRGIGVVDDEMAVKVQQIVASAEHQPRIAVRPRWYYL